MKEVVMVKKWKYRSMGEALMSSNVKLEKGIIEKEYDGREISYHGTSEYETIRVIRDEAGNLYKCSDMARGFEKDVEYIEVERLEQVEKELNKYLNREIKEMQKKLKDLQSKKVNLSRNIRKLKNRC